MEIKIFIKEINIPSIKAVEIDSFYDDRCDIERAKNPILQVMPPEPVQFIGIIKEPDKKVLEYLGNNINKEFLLVPINS